jgi:hypothetical protein
MNQNRSNPAMKIKTPIQRGARVLAGAMAILAVVSCVVSCVKSSYSTKADGIEVSPLFEIPAEVRGDEPLKAKDGEYSVGAWRSSVGVFDLKFVVRGGKVTDEFFTQDGKRLKESTDPVPEKTLERIRNLSAATGQPTVFEFVMNALVCNAQAGCNRCTRGVKYVRDGNDVFGFCIGGRGDVCYRGKVNSAR